MTKNLNTVSATARLFTPDTPLVLASDAESAPVDVAYETHEELNLRGSNAIFVCHALTGGAHATGLKSGSRKPGWWDSLVGPGKAVDANRRFMVCANVLGGCHGTTGPSSVSPATGKPYGLDFPLLAMSDFVTVRRRLGQHLGVDRWAVLLEGSLGGIQVPQWMLSYPQDRDNAVIIAASSRLTAQNIAFSAVDRQAIMRDSVFRGGRFLSEGTVPAKGLSVTRMLTHITYLSEDAFSAKFGRTVQSEKLDPGFEIDFAVEDYLEYQGKAFLERFDALSYLYLTRVMGYFDPFTSGDALARLMADSMKFLLVSFDGGWRFDTGHSRRIVQHLEGAGLPTSFRKIHSQWGHGSFLLGLPDYHAILRASLDRISEEGNR